MKAVIAASNEEKAPVGAFSVITNLRMDLFEALVEGAPVSISADTLGWSWRSQMEAERVESRKIKCYPSYISFL